MQIKIFFLAAALAAILACRPATEAARAPETTGETERAARAEAEAARAAVSKRLDALDAEIQKIDTKAEKASAKTKAKLEETGREMRAEARKLRDRMSTWDDKAGSAWRDAKREIEDGLDKSERVIKNLVDDIKK